MPPDFANTIVVFRWLWWSSDFSLRRSDADRFTLQFNVSTTIGWVAMKFGTHIMNLNYLILSWLYCHSSILCTDTPPEGVCVGVSPSLFMSTILSLRRSIERISLQLTFSQCPLPKAQTVKISLTIKAVFHGRFSLKSCTFHPTIHQPQNCCMFLWAIGFIKVVAKRRTGKIKNKKRWKRRRGSKEPFDLGKSEWEVTPLPRGSNFDQSSCLSGFKPPLVDGMSRKKNE